MEAASVPADAAESQEGTEEAQPEQQAQADLTPVLERLDELSRGMGQLQPLLQHQEPEPDPDLGLDQVFPDDGYGNQQLDPSALNTYIEQQVERRIAAHDQRVTAVEQRQLDQEWDALAEQYPKLQDPKFAEEIGGEVRRFAEARGVPALAADPDFVEMVFLAKEARDRAAREVPAGSGEEVHLEGSSATAGEPETDADQDIARRMLAAGGPGSLWGG